MLMTKIVFQIVNLIVVVILSLGLTSSVSIAADMPDYMDIMVGNNPPETKSQSAEQNILGLNVAMMGIYGDALQKFQKNFVAQHPVILALFSGEGGRLTLYRPGKEPLLAPPVPMVYQLVKSVSHSSMAIFELGASHLGSVSDQSWRGPRLTYRAANQAALDGLDALDVSSDIRDNLRYNIKAISSSWTRA
jgi:hypothetical protein